MTAEVAARRPLVPLTRRYRAPRRSVSRRRAGYGGLDLAGIVTRYRARDHVRPHGRQTGRVSYALGEGGGLTYR